MYKHSFLCVLDTLINYFDFSEKKIANIYVSNLLNVML